MDFRGFHGVSHWIVVELCGLFARHVYVNMCRVFVVLLCRPYGLIDELSK